MTQPATDHRDAVAAICAAAARAIKPTPALTPSQWAAENRVLSTTSRNPGAWRNKRTPYLAEPMDHFGWKSNAEEIVLVFAAQTGKT